MATILAIALATALVAQGPSGSGGIDVVPQARQASFIELDRAEAMARYGHPNEMWRYRALRALKLEQPARAAEYFRLGARYADKFSQHALSLLYWHGVGVMRDRARAYVWADLAAERGYRDLLLVREKMWMEMSAAQRAQALLFGEEMYGQYGDAAAKPRMEWAMRKELARGTGGRLGFYKDYLQFLVARDGIGARDFYRDDRWESERYWREQDRQWKAKVIVLPPQSMPPDASEPSGSGAGRQGVSSKDGQAAGY